MAIPTQFDHYQRILQYEQSQRRRLGRPRMVQYLVNRRYYYGDNAQPDDVNQPLGIRYVPRIVQKHVHYLFGEWESDILDWVVTPLDKKDVGQHDVAADIARAIYRLMRRANADELIYRAALDAAIYGDAVFKLRYDHAIGGATFETVLPEYYHAMWHPLNVGETIEALVAYNLDRTAAFQLFGTVGNPRYVNHMSMLDPGFATVWEHWTADRYELVVDDQLVTEGENPYRPIPKAGETPQPAWLPFIHIPNLAVNGEYYGFGEAEPIFELQDELNMRIADFGDIINYHAHPITIVKNYFGRLEDLRTGPDVVWDMGREGEAEYLEWSGKAPGVLEYLQLLMTVLFDTASLTGIAFGRTEQSQASGSALVVQMLPIVEVVRRKRATWGPKLRELAKRLLELESMSMSAERFRALYGFDADQLANFTIQPKWAPILPRDRAAVVNENVALLVNKARSIVTALKDLGTDDPEEERDRIIADLKEFAEIELEFETATLEAEAEVNKDLARHELGLADVRVGRVTPRRADRTPNRSGGKNADAATGGSNTDA